MIAHGLLDLALQPATLPAPAEQLLGVVLAELPGLARDADAWSEAVLTLRDAALDDHPAQEGDNGLFASESPLLPQVCLT
eukprot:COSAG01_NODE_17058_length_1181_cov_452.509242_2_plen_79_part_01